MVPPWLSSICSVPATVTFPPRPTPTLLLLICAPSLSASRPTCTSILPAWPLLLLDVSATITPLSLIVSVGVEMDRLPAWPLPDCALLNSPLRRPPSLRPAMVIVSVATTVTSPPRPAPKVLLLIWAPPVSMSRPTCISILPAWPRLPEPVPA
jgi:hypothetical protein